MDNASDIIENFEELLKKGTSKSSLNLYNATTNTNKNYHNERLNPQDVINKVSSQLRAIQKADVFVNTSKTCQNVMNTLKESSFLPVNVVPRYTNKEPISKTASKFEPQLDLDTQLIDILENAESLIDGNIGMTQEFNNTFYEIDKIKGHSRDEVSNPINKNGMYKECIEINQNINCYKPETDCENSKALIKLPSTSKTHIDMNENSTNVSTKCAEAESNVQVSDKNLDCIDIPCSYIFESFKKSNTPSPLIFELSKFETFEKLAHPVVDLNTGMESVKHLINSQIIGNEMFIRFDESRSQLEERCSSPILEKNSNQLKFSKTMDDNRNNNAQNLSWECKNEGTFLNDEILFSSDEESEYLHKKQQDLALTCCLGTSVLSDESLDKTMYVGFQTASNRSIQINTASFKKAKSILDEDDATNVKLSELVKICDNAKICMKHTDTKNNVILNESSVCDSELERNVMDTDMDNVDMSLKVESGCNKITDKLTDLLEKVPCISNTNVCQNFKLPRAPYKRKLDGFSTASNKKIKISTEAIAKSKKMFGDIDLVDHTFERVCNKYNEEEIVHVDENITKRFGKYISPFENEQNKPHVVFLGFKTASKKDIIISDSAIAQTNKIFEDFNMESKHLSEQTINMKPVCELKSKNLLNNLNCKNNMAYKTANNKQNKVSKKFIDIYGNAINIEKINDAVNTPTLPMPDKAITDSEKFLDDLDLDSLELNISKIQKKDLQVISKQNTNLNIIPTASQKSFDVNVSSNAFIGFQTASKKPVKISAQALVKSASLFKDVNGGTVNKTAPDSQQINPYIGEGLMNSQRLSTRDLFMTASQKPVKVLDEALASSKAVFGHDFDKMTIRNSDLPSTAFKGFQTANKKIIKISAQGLAKSATLFKDIDGIDKDITVIDSHKICPNIVDKDMNSQKLSTRDLFMTASQKHVEVSDEALASSNAVLGHKIDKTIISNMAYSDSGNLSSTIFKGFQTANKNPIKISADALTKSKSFFNEIEEYASDFPGDKVLNDNENSFIQINSENLVKIFDETMVSNNAILENETDIENYRNVDAFEYNEIPSPTFKGFQTANKKPIQISALELAKSRAFMKEIKDDTTIDNISKITNRVPVNVVLDDEVMTSQILSTRNLFLTASQKPVEISEEALLSSKTMLEINTNKIFTNFGIKPQEVSSIPCKGFQTASKRPIKISEQALAKSTALFKDIDVNTSSDLHKKDEETYDFIKIHEEEPIFRGFQMPMPSANKKSCINKTLINSKLLGNNINLIKEKYAQDKKFRENYFRGFHTDKEIIKGTRVAKNTLIGNDEGNTNVEESEKHSPCEFQTASNKQVIISEGALKKSKQLLVENSVEVIASNTKRSKVEVTNKEYLYCNILNRNNSYKTVSQNATEMISYALEETKQRNENSYKRSLKKNTEKEENNYENIIDTQVLNNFEGTLCTKDFCKRTTPILSKRSGSPILSCPRAKKRKRFETPYKNGTILAEKEVKVIARPSIRLAYDNGLLSPDYKRNKSINLKDLYKVEINKDKKPIDLYITEFTLDTLLNFQFFGTRNDVSAKVTTVGDIKKYFYNMVNNKLVPEGWFENHIKLIIWKLISYEVKFPTTLPDVCSVKNVLKQLKYRYDKELYEAERPALRKILERDDTASKPMVLCVAGVYVDGLNVSCVSNITSNVELLLTDGWYCVKATIDKMLTKLVYDGKISVGCKIVTNGAELMNCDQGIAPWEDTSSIRLKICGNSTRRARWDARLGYHGKAAILSQLSCIQPDGGKVSKLRLFVSRVYPALYIEKFEDGSTVTRSERLEHIHQNKCETERQNAMEKLYEEVEKELSDQESLDTESSIPNRKCYGIDSQSLMAPLSDSQAKRLEAKCNKRQEKMLSHVQSKVQKKIEKFGLNAQRKIVPLLKVRVAGVQSKGTSIAVTKGLLSVWKPNDAITEIIKEGSWIEVLNVVPTAMRYSEIQISAGRQSIFKESKYKETEIIKPYIESLKRKHFSIKDLAENPTKTTDYNEIDTAGFVFQIDPSNSNFEISKQLFQNVYLADAEKNIICINFWGGLKKFGYHNVLDTGQILACVNLQKRTGNTKKYIPHYRVTEFSYFTKSPKNVHSRNIIDELVKKFKTLDKRKYCEDCILKKNHFSRTLNGYNENVSPYRFNNEHNLSKNKVFIDSPLVQKPNDDNLNLSGLDFESTFKQETQPVSPKSLQRKKKVNEKIAKLSMYGAPPPLSTIHIINKSVSAMNTYRSPLVLKLDTSAASVRHDKKPDITCSPIMCMNRTYVKSMNPIKLNFSNTHDNNEDEVDHYAEDFDGSPPLSLD